jgi:hypothetical protein
LYGNFDNGTPLGTPSTICLALTPLPGTHISLWTIILVFQPAEAPDDCFPKGR